MSLWKRLFGGMAQHSLRPRIAETEVNDSSPVIPSSTAKDRVVRVFISSTFRDMHAERDHLVTVVFPELRERIEQLGLEFFDVDLRWGVPETGVDGEKANSWEYCKRWIDRVEPFFVCMLGQRYGWVPKPHEIKDNEDRKLWTGRSVTDMEIRHAVLSQRIGRRSSFYLRETLVPETPRTDPAIYGEFVDTDPVSFRNLEQLKAEIRTCGHPVRPYDCRWDGKSFVDLDTFGRLVLDDLWSGVLRDERYVSKDVWRQALGADPETDPRYTDETQPVPPHLAAKIVGLAKPPPKDPLDAEREQMQAFAASRLRWFQGRTHELRQLTDFIQSTDETTPRLAVVAAVPGQGKSALLAKLSTLIPHPSTFLITHFVGATERSASAHALIERLLGELDRSGIEWHANEQKEEDEPKRDFNSLCLRLAERLGDYAGARRIVILLDALNQLSDGHALHWLPQRLGPGVRVVVSCVEDAAAKADSPESRILHALASRKPAPLRVPLGPLTEADIRAIVVEYLKEYCHELGRQHLDVLCAIPQARNPLYLLVMLNELRTLGGNDLNVIVPARIASMSRDYPDTVALFRWVLQRMEVYGSEGVRWWCLYLAHGRVGLASQELADLLARKLNPNDAVTALLIERGLRRYLLRRGGQLDFFHGQLRQAVMEHYGPRAKSDIVHSEIAEYFDTQSWFLEGGRSQRVPNQRKCAELLHHRLLSGDARSVRNLLFSFELNETKIAAGLIYDLIDEYSRSYAALPKGANDKVLMVLLRQAIQRHSAFLQKHVRQYPQALLQSCYNSLGHLCCQGDTSFVDSANSSRLGKLLESWRESLNSLYPDSYWMRSRIQPLISLGTQLQTLCEEDGVNEGKVRVGKCKIDFSSDGAQLTSVSDMLCIRAFHTHTGKQTAHVEVARPSCRANEIAISTDGGHIAGVCGDGTLRMWRTNTGDEVFCVNTAKSSITALTYSPDGLVIAGGFQDGTIRIWGTRTGKNLRSLRGNSSAVQCIAFSSSGSFLVTRSSDDKIRLWDANKQSRQLKCFRFPSDHWGRKVCFLPGNDDIIVVGSSSIIVLLDAKTGRTISRFAENKEISTCSLAISADGTSMARRTHSAFQIFDIRQGKTTFSFHSPFLVGDAIAISPDGKLVATGVFDGFGIWDLSLDAPCQTMTHERYQRGTEDISVWGTSGAEDLKIVSVSTDGSLCIWRYEQPFMKLLRKFTHKTDSEGIKFVTFSPDGRLFAVINSENRYTLNTVSLYDSIANRLHAKVVEHSDGMYSDVLSGTFFQRFPSVWVLPEGACVDVEYLRRLHGYPDAGMSGRFTYTDRNKKQTTVSTDALAVGDLACKKDGERDPLRLETSHQLSIAKDDKLLIWEAAAGNVVAYYPAGLSQIKAIPMTATWSASSSAGLEIISLEHSSAKLW